MCQTISLISSAHNTKVSKLNNVYLAEQNQFMKYITTLLLTACFFPLIAQQESYVEKIENNRKKHVSEMTDPTKRILNEEEIAKYISHDYFPIDSTYRLFTKVLPAEKEILKMPTSAKRIKTFEVMGCVAIQLPDMEIDTLYILQDVELRKKWGYEKDYFIPFKDQTSGQETYGGGRYLDVKIFGDDVVIDFNKAYNPYCAFSARYNCPIPPKRNFLKISIAAGEKTPLLRED